jgi:FAD-dependent monooxygenase
LSREKAITSWQLPSVDDYRKKIREQNDGTLPLEPYQRISQAFFEAWLKGLSDENPLMDFRFGWKVESVVDDGDGVKTIAVNVDTGKRQSFRSSYVGACDGASSKVRTGLGIPLDGGPV